MKTMGDDTMIAMTGVYLDSRLFKDAVSEGTIYLETEVLKLEERHGMTSCSGHGSRY